MENLNIEEKRAELENRIKYLNEKIGNATAYKLDIYQLNKFEEERKKLIESYNHLPPKEIFSGELIFTPKISYHDDRLAITLRQGENGKWYCLEDSELGIRTEIVTDYINTPIELRRHLNSNRNGGKQINSFKVILKEPKIQPIAKCEPTPIKPCSKVDEGLAAMQPFDGKRYGLIQDASTKQWIMPTPKE